MRQLEPFSDRSTNWEYSITIMPQEAKGSFRGEYHGDLGGGIFNKKSLFGRYDGSPEFIVPDGTFFFEDISQLKGRFNIAPGSYVGRHDASMRFEQPETGFTFHVSGVLQNVVNESYLITGWIQWI